jgi:quercetin dioxygenase-like cupin family protein
MSRLHFVPKGWGYEKWICNSEKYCGKILHFVKDRQCSLHFHKLKDETFYVRSGLVRVCYAGVNPEDVPEDLSLAQAILSAGDYFHVPPNTAHQILALEDSEIIEFSTQHFDEDSYRLEKGD